MNSNASSRRFSSYVQPVLKDSRLPCRAGKTAEMDRENPYLFRLNAILAELPGGGVPDCARRAQLEANGRILANAGELKN